MVREFVDAAGVVWRAWDVRSATPRRQVHRRKTSPTDFSGPNRRIRRDRRVRKVRTPDAWLAFESATEKRRLHPIPAEWELASEADLRRWCSEGFPLPTFVAWIPEPMPEEEEGARE